MKANGMDLETRPRPTVGAVSFLELNRRVKTVLRRVKFVSGIESELYHTAASYPIFVFVTYSLLLQPTG
jgi:hypothetical protein